MYKRSFTLKNEKLQFNVVLQIAELAHKYSKAAQAS